MATSSLAAARSLQDSGRHAEAAAAFEAVLAQKPKAQNSAIRLGRCREALGQRAEAIAAYRRAIDIEPDSYEASKATYFLMQACMAAGDREGARAASVRTKEKHPDSSFIARTRAMELALDGKSPASAEREIERELRAAEAYDQGLALSRQGEAKRADALKALEKAERDFPGTAAALRARVAGACADPCRPFGEGQGGLRPSAGGCGERRSAIAACAGVEDAAGRAAAGERQPR